MSVDSSGTTPRLITLDALMDKGPECFAELLGVPGVPRFEVTARLGPPLVPGRSVVLGEDERDYFTIQLAGSEDRFLLLVMQHGDHPPTEDEEDWEHATDLNFDPWRRPVAVVGSIAFALAAATLGGGGFDSQVLRTYPVHDPAEILASTRLPQTPGETVAGACRRYLDQFPDLRGWPSS